MLRFRCFGFPVAISVWFCAGLCVLAVVDRSGSLRWGLLAAAMHECGHLAAMRGLHWRACEVRLTALGIRLVRHEQTPYPNREELLVTLAGPMVNLCAGTLLALAAWIFSRAAALRTAGMAQFALGLFNLLPIDPLDGGHALQALLDRRLPPDTAARITRWVAFAALLPLATAAFVTLFWQRGNVSLLAVTVYLVVFFVLRS